ncbi:MAG: 4Fe-4S binding protein [Candidatus Wallbacteria bacterium]|nr:4Fe-4S binding protein [Candidatus Wallbacteria bacterium]
MVSGSVVIGHLEAGAVGKALEELKRGNQEGARALGGECVEQLPELKSPEDLQSWRNQTRGRASGPVRQALVCAGTGCRAAGAVKVSEALARWIEASGSESRIGLEVKETGCHGFCEKGPLVVVRPEETLYVGVKESDASEIVERTLARGEPISRLLCADASSRRRVLRWPELPFYAEQRRVVLRNAGRIDPASLTDYVASGGYDALSRVLRTMSPEGVIEEIARSGLRGRGGAGYPTGLKWKRCAEAVGGNRVIVCNGDEGDPGAYMDRSLIEADPHSVLEGMIIGAYAIGATTGHIYIRHEYPLALEQMGRAVSEARRAGLLGRAILGSRMDFDVSMTRGGGAFVCGEETALLASIEGKPGRPRPRPPYPTERGLFDLPTVINNVETLASVTRILEMGAAAYAAIGTERSKGTKIFSLVGKARNTGLVEVPMGTSIRDLVEKVGGGVPRGRKLKAVQIGGPSGGCLPESELDRPVDYEALGEAGAIMGSGGIIVMDDRTCMVDVARYFTDFLEKESCGKCTPCRDGLRELRENLETVTLGRATAGGLDEIEEMARAIGLGSLCGLGRTAVNPVLSTLRHFRAEYLSHVEDGKCPAGVCRELARFRVNERCNGCGLCREACPVNAISGETRSPHAIAQESCVRCGACLDVCHRGGIDILSRRELEEAAMEVAS